MKTLTLLAACFATAKAWQVALYAEDGCVGEYYYIEDQAPCRQPEEMPPDFDAKSMQVIDVPATKAVWAFTDVNIKCNHGFEAPSNTFLVYGANNGISCHPLKSTKTGKWRIVSVEDVV